jgi:hypothetical protein
MIVQYHSSPASQKLVTTKHEKGISVNEEMQGGYESVFRNSHGALHSLKLCFCLKTLETVEQEGLKMK